MRSANAEHSSGMHHHDATSALAAYTEIGRESCRDLESKIAEEDRQVGTERRRVGRPGHGL